MSESTIATEVDSGTGSISKERIVLKNTIGEWVITAFIYAVIFAFFMVYHHLRGRPYDLFLANKCFAISSTTSISLALMFGPLCRLCNIPAVFLKYRRSLGVVGGCTLLLHLVISVFVLPDLFPLSYYYKNWFSTVLGLNAMLFILFASIISHAHFIKILNQKWWKTLQRYLYLAILAGTLHFVILGKLPNWSKWLSNPQGLPPGTMIPAMIVLITLFLRCVDEVMRRRAK